MRARAIALFAICLILASAQPVQADERRLALLIGNQGYADAVGPLENPHNDIALLRDALTQIGFEVLPLVKDGTHREIRRAVYEFTDRLDEAGSDAIGFFYYSGHGIAETEEGPNYLIPVNVQRLTPSALRLDALRLNEITDILAEEAPRAAHFVFFDACRNELRGFKGSKGFIPESERQGMVIAFASAPGRTASDGGEGGGPFARALARELVRPAQDHYTTLFNVREELSNDPEITQFPWWRDGLRTRVYFAGEEDASRLEQDYRRAERIGTEAAWRAFLARHEDQQNNFLVQLARAALQKLAVGTFPEPPEPAPDTCDGVEVDLASGGTRCIKPGSGESFKDCAECPEMVVVPAGTFMMGSSEQEISAVIEKFGHDWPEAEGPRHMVNIAKPFAVAQYPITVKLFENFVSGSGYEIEKGCLILASDGVLKKEKYWRDPPAFSQEENHPVVCVSWEDANAYINWLSAKTGNHYRLLSEAQWEYVWRAGSQSDDWFSSQETQYTEKTFPVTSFEPNPWGIVYQLNGQIYEWTADCWNDSYENKPEKLKRSGGAWTTGTCSSRVNRGTSWIEGSYQRIAAERSQHPVNMRSYNIGFRVARMLGSPAELAGE